LEELLVSSLAQTDALAKLLIEKGRLTERSLCRRFPMSGRRIGSYYYTAMTIGEILTWEATNVVLLVPVVFALMILTRWIRRLPLFTDRDSLFLIGHPRGRKFVRLSYKLPCVTLSYRDMVRRCPTPPFHNSPNVCLVTGPYGTARKGRATLLTIAEE
jgi:hypothetical protein